MASWYEWLFGVEESTRAVHLGFKVEDDTLVAPNGQRFGIGRFSTPCLKTLRQTGEAQGAKGRVRVNHEVIGDVLELHAQPENAGALFQVASQLNTLEFPGPNTVPEDGITGYASDPTQGPACALAAAAASVYRNDFVPLAGGVGQHHDTQIDLLSDLALRLGEPDAYFTVRNGYTFSDTSRLNQLARRLRQVGREACLDQIRIGLQSQVEVTWAQRFVRPERPTFVSQAFCSAISCGYVASVPLQAWTPLATLVLDAMYEATLWATILDKAEGRGSGRVWLTFVGGGVFGNEPAWIVHAIRRAIDRVRGFAIDIRIAHYGELHLGYANAIDHRGTEG
ncbi:MAG: hypothetical protein AAGA48_11660 [Myxococcota bacterium]